jgi:hypothetical protein
MAAAAAANNIDVALRDLQMAPSMSLSVGSDFYFTDNVNVGIH